MAILKPFRRTCRQFSNGSYGDGGQWRYLLHKKYAKDPQHYVRAFLLLQADLLELFTYIEPAETNAHTYSHHIQQLLMRACVEIEANLTAVLTENGYVGPRRHLTMQDYILVDHSHRLSSYEVRIPGWHGQGGIRYPFSTWKADNKALPWYRDYNKSKHNRHEFFQLATFGSLIDAICGLAVVLSAQFHDENYSPVSKSIGIGPGYSYDTDDEMESAIGDFFRVKFPMNWPAEERYEFNWDELQSLEDPYGNFDYSPFI